ncbi:hypothetical protein B484DRAFT_455364 [Ochromonadaceae sp. CCMP2298]|nr:hypothetical protein B484DRAFT_455364 [Ochromonadaceae sp. CCMP2298]
MAAVPILKVTAVTCGVLGLLHMTFIMMIVHIRRSEKILVGSGANKALEFMMRGHANFHENVPLALIMLLVAELSSFAPTVILAATSLCFVVGRCLHAYSFLTSLSMATHLQFRFPGMVMTLLATVALLAIVLMGGLRVLLN